MAEESKAKVLCAAGPEMDERLHECLPGHELSFVRTMHEAIATLRRDGYQLMVIELNFDESRMFELLRYVRALPGYRDVRVICVYGDPLSDALIRNIDVAVKALGGIAFLDLRGGAPLGFEHCRFLDSVAARAATAH